MKQLPAWFQEKDNCYLVHSAWLVELIIHIHVYRVFSNILISATLTVQKNSYLEFFKQSIFHPSKYFPVWKLLASAVFNAFKDSFVFTFYIKCALMSFVQYVGLYCVNRLIKETYSLPLGRLKIDIFKKKKKSCRSYFQRLFLNLFINLQQLKGRSCYHHFM